VPTDWRLTSWLFTKQGGVESGQEGGFEPVTSRLPIQHPNQKATQPPPIART